MSKAKVMYNILCSVFCDYDKMMRYVGFRYMFDQKSRMHLEKAIEVSKVYILKLIIIIGNNRKHYNHSIQKK